MVINKDSKGCRRNTPQRIKILEFLNSVRSHPTAEEVFKAVKKDIPTITLATVYRNLNLLAREGQILRLEVNHEYRYDAFSKDHIHFVCEDSDKIIDIENKEVMDFIKSKLGKRFNPRKITVMVDGVCEG